MNKSERDPMLWVALPNPMIRIPADFKDAKDFPMSKWYSASWWDWIDSWYIDDVTNVFKVFQDALF